MTLRLKFPFHSIIANSMFDERFRRGLRFIVEGLKFKIIGLQEMSGHHSMDDAQLKDAILRASSFLRERLRSGNYGLDCVGSDGSPKFSHNSGHLFVASFIAEAMFGLFDEIDRTLVITRILSEEYDGAWGYQPPGLCHTDETKIFYVEADDTAFVIRTLQKLGVNRPPECLLRFYRETERLFVTFDGPGPIASTTLGSPQNNFLAHPEVNLNVFLALRETHLKHLINFNMLLEAQDKRGVWKSFFYPSLLYATTLALDLIGGHPTYSSAADSAFLYILGAQNADGSWGIDSDSYETALAIGALARHPAYTQSVDRGVAFLLSNMAQDGSWTTKSCVWEFHASENDVWRAFDRHRAYVSARCLTALRRVAGQLHS